MGYSYKVSYAPSDRAKCSGCSRKIKKDSLRISRESGPIKQFGDHSITQHFHYNHIFDKMKNSKCTTNVLLGTNKLNGYSSIKDSDKKSIKKQVKRFSEQWRKKCKLSSRRKSRMSRKSRR